MITFLYAIRIHGQSGQLHDPQEDIICTKIISKMTVHFSVKFLNFSFSFHSQLLKIFVEEQHDLVQAKDNVNILQRGLLRPADFLQLFSSCFILFPFCTFLLLIFVFSSFLYSSLSSFSHFHFPFFQSSDFFGCRLSIIGTGVI